ncbi:hypothetical protein PROAA_120001 [Candidatus Propionivibrio aalborgensis]|uniref:Uncharacterized protein n=1 Tax=Candidatus Propionivibrio aalborgensis TaxID=1860101 RepID=A0A1A8XFW3_9RHOO|nr:hypothetical protein [Candidatus Propionivibrio aalborgensis]MBK9029133.1 hypothetical protein [Propionivibrio sp.]SBT04069.1 hypothetical protein PROAA_120001 [Candidatus Propionivibrio aalborgensis]
MSSNNQAELLKERVRCGVCQHGIRVRGIELIACLPHLDMRSPVIDRICAEFEGKKKERVSENESLSVQTSQSERQNPEQS